MFGCTNNANNNPPGPSPDQVKLELRVLDDTNRTVFEGSKEFPSKTNGLVALQQMVSVETQQSSFGKFVKAINGKAADNSHYWALYLDGQYAMVGIESVSLEKDTRIEWRLEAIQAAPSSG